jgi:hypothetical protein
MDNGVMRIAQFSTIGILNLDDRMSQIQVDEGQFNLHVRHLDDDQAIEIDTPNAAVTILREGDYRIDVNPHENVSFVAVRNGTAEITGGGQAFTLNAGNAAQLTGSDSLSYDLSAAPTFDSFDIFCQQHDQRFAHIQSLRYVSEDMIGYEDLDGNGSWRTDGTYGAVWYPSRVQTGWAPYRYGHWAWIEPWGWTWVDDASWGFAPFHYGRWVYTGNGWGWAPGPIAVVEVGRPRPRPWYAPALVAFVGGSGWGVSISTGSAAVGWVPLGWGEVYRPPYHVSPRYFQTVNVSNTVVNKTANITNIYNTTYVNKTVINNVTYVNTRSPNAVTAMPQQAFASGQPSSRSAISLNKQQVAQVQPSATVLAPPVAPTRTAVAPTYQVRGNTPRPEALVMQRPVVAKAAPPPPPPSFQSKQAYLTSHAGQPFNAQQMRQVVPRPQASNLVRQAPPISQTAPARKVAVAPSNAAKPAPNAAVAPPRNVPNNAPTVPTAPTVLHPANAANEPSTANQPPNARPPQRPAADGNRVDGNQKMPNKGSLTAPPRPYPKQAPHPAQTMEHAQPPTKTPPAKSQKLEKKAERKPD